MTVSFGVFLSVSGESSNLTRSSSSPPDLTIAETDTVNYDGASMKSMCYIDENLILDYVF